VVVSGNKADAHGHGDKVDEGGEQVTQPDRHKDLRLS
jgi:hypothetical protein